jgi:hypothetical protein
MKWGKLRLKRDGLAMDGTVRHGDTARSWRQVRTICGLGMFGERLRARLERNEE